MTETDDKAAKRIEFSQPFRCSDLSETNGLGTKLSAEAGKSRKRRYTATPSRLEVNWRAIPILPSDGWQLLKLEQFPIVGTVPKNYLSYGDPFKHGTRGYIAKKGRTKNDARECVTEEIISQIGALLPLKIANSKLVRLSRTDVRFLSRNFVERGQFELLHGTELAARYFETSPKEVESAFELSDRNAEQNFYSVGNILTILEALFPNENSALKEGFFKMLAFDAFIGAPDRHAMNWGVLAPVSMDEAPVSFAPIFDTARGLFREISDEDLHQKEKQQDREWFLAKYAERSRPILNTGEATQQNHFELVKWVLENPRIEGRQAMRTVFDAVEIDSIEHLLQ